MQLLTCLPDADSGRKNRSFTHCCFPLNEDYGSIESPDGLNGQEELGRGWIEGRGNTLVQWTAPHACVFIRSSKPEQPSCTGSGGEERSIAHHAHWKRCC